MAESGSLKAAEEAAARVNAMLVATGQLRTSDIVKSKSKTGKSSDLFVEKVVINDAPLSARNYLTRSSAQEEISKMSGASVATRGRYMSKEEIDNNKTADRPLFLHIQGVKEQDVKVAVGRIMHIIMVHTHRKNTPNSQNQVNENDNLGSSTEHLMDTDSDAHQNPPLLNNENITENPVIFCPKVFREKVFLPMSSNMNPVDVRLRLVGEEGSNLIYIKNETGASIFMRGIGSGFVEPNLGVESQEALHFYLEHTNEEKFNEAKDLIVNLAQTILTQMHQEPQAHQQQQANHLAPNVPLNPQPPVLQQPMFQSTLPPAPIALNGNVPPPTIHQAPPPPTANIPVQNVSHAVIAHPPSSQLTMQVNPFQVPVVVSAPQPVNTVVSHNHQLLEGARQHHNEPPHPTHLVQISLASAPPGPDVVTQQIVQTSATRQVLHFSPAPQIVNSLEGPRVISFTPVSSVASTFVPRSVPTQQSDGTLGVVLTPSLPQSLPQTAPSVPVPQPVFQPMPHQLPPQTIIQATPQIVHQPPNALPPQSEVPEQRRENIFANPPHVHFPFPPRTTHAPDVSSPNIFASSETMTCASFASKDVRVTQPQFVVTSHQHLENVQTSAPYLANALAANSDVAGTSKAGSEWNMVNKNLPALNHGKLQSTELEQQNNPVQFSGMDRTASCNDQNFSTDGQKPIISSSCPLPWAQYSQPPLQTLVTSEASPVVKMQSCSDQSPAVLLNDGGSSTASKVAPFVSEYSNSSGLASLQGAPLQGSSCSSYSPKRTCAPRDYCPETKRYRSFWSKGDDSYLNSDDIALDSSEAKDSAANVEAKGPTCVPMDIFRHPPPQIIRNSIPSNGSHPSPAVRNFRPGNRSGSLRPFNQDFKMPPMFKGHQYRDSGDAWHNRNQHEGWGAAGLRPGLRENHWQRGGPRNPSIGRPFMHYDKPFTKTRFPYRQ